MYDKGSALMGIGLATGETRATEAAKKAISSPLLETSIDGAHGILMNITGGTNLSLYEVQEAADLVTSAADKEVNVIFGSVINDSLKDEIIVTVIATGFKEIEESAKQPKHRPVIKHHQHAATNINDEYSVPLNDSRQDHDEDTLDVPTFLRNRNR